MGGGGRRRRGGCIYTHIHVHACMHAWEEGVGGGGGDGRALCFSQDVGHFAVARSLGFTSVPTAVVVVVVEVHPFLKK